ncbi:MAG: hypothetical protein ACKO96_12725, partial [Flammeovirgaceae bacterium]
MSNIKYRIYQLPLAVLARVTIITNRKISLNQRTLLIRHIARIRHNNTSSSRQYKLSQTIREYRFLDVRARLGDGKDLPAIAQVVAQWVQVRPLLKPVQEITATDALAKITRHHAAFTPSMMERTLKSIIPEDGLRKHLIEDILQSDAVVKIGKYNGRDVYSTREMIVLEKGMADTGHEMTRHASHKVDDHAIERAILNLNKQLRKQTHGKASLSSEQK